MMCLSCRAKKNWGLYEISRFIAIFLLKKSEKVTLILWESIWYSIKCKRDNAIYGLCQRLLTSPLKTQESNAESKYNVKNRLCPKECCSVNWDSVIFSTPYLYCCDFVFHPNLVCVDCFLSVLLKQDFQTNFHYFISVRNIPKIMRFKSHLK